MKRGYSGRPLHPLATRASLLTNREGDDTLTQTMAEVETSTEEIVARLVEEFDPEKIILFGSNAWGTPQSGSDLDLLVIVRSATRPPTQRAAQAYRCLQGIKTPVDIIVVTRTELSRYASVPASLSRKILNQGKVLYG